MGEARTEIVPQRLPEATRPHPWRYTEIADLIATRPPEAIQALRQKAEMLAVSKSYLARPPELGLSFRHLVRGVLGTYGQDTAVLTQTNGLLAAIEVAGLKDNQARKKMLAAINRVNSARGEPTLERIGLEATNGTGWRWVICPNGQQPLFLSLTKRENTLRWDSNLKGFGPFLTRDYRVFRRGKGPNTLVQEATKALRPLTVGWQAKDGSTNGRGPKPLEKAVATRILPENFNQLSADQRLGVVAQSLHGQTELLLKISNPQNLPTNLQPPSRLFRAATLQIFDRGVNQLKEAAQESWTEPMDKLVEMYRQGLRGVLVGMGPVKEVESEEPEAVEQYFKTLGWDTMGERALTTKYFSQVDKPDERQMVQSVIDFARAATPKNFFDNPRNLPEVEAAMAGFWKLVNPVLREEMTEQCLPAFFALNQLGLKVEAAPAQRYNQGFSLVVSRGETEGLDPQLVRVFGLEKAPRAVIYLKEGEEAADFNRQIYGDHQIPARIWNGIMPLIVRLTTSTTTHSDQLRQLGSEAIGENAVYVGLPNLRISSSLGIPTQDNIREFQNAVRMISPLVDESGRLIWSRLLNPEEIRKEMVADSKRGWPLTAGKRSGQEILGEEIIKTDETAREQQGNEAVLSGLSRDKVAADILGRRADELLEGEEKKISAKAVRQQLLHQSLKFIDRSVRRTEEIKALAGSLSGGKDQAEARVDNFYVNTYKKIKDIYFKDVFDQVEVSLAAEIKQREEGLRWTKSGRYNRQDYANLRQAEQKLLVWRLGKAIISGQESPKKFIETELQTLDSRKEAMRLRLPLLQRVIKGRKFYRSDQRMIDTMEDDIHYWQTALVKASSQTGIIEFLQDQALMWQFWKKDDTELKQTKDWVIRCLELRQYLSQKGLLRKAKKKSV
jgi:hypothetical protein